MAGCSAFRLSGSLNRLVVVCRSLFIYSEGVDMAAIGVLRRNLPDLSCGPVHKCMKKKKKTRSSQATQICRLQLVVAGTFINYISHQCCTAYDQKQQWVPEQTALTARQSITPRNVSQSLDYR